MAKTTSSAIPNIKDLDPDLAAIKEKDYDTLYKKLKEMADKAFSSNYTEIADDLSESPIINWGLNKIVGSDLDISLLNKDENMSILKKILSDTKSENFKNSFENVKLPSVISSCWDDSTNDDLNAFNKYNSTNFQDLYNLSPRQDCEKKEDYLLQDTKKQKIYYSSHFKEYFLNIQNNIQSRFLNNDNQFDISTLDNIQNLEDFEKYLQTVDSSSLLKNTPYNPLLMSKYTSLAKTKSPILFQMYNQPKLNMTDCLRCGNFSMFNKQSFSVGFNYKIPGSLFKDVISTAIDNYFTKIKTDWSAWIKGSSGSAPIIVAETWIGLLAVFFLSFKWITVHIPICSLGGEFEIGTNIFLSYDIAFNYQVDHDEQYKVGRFITKTRYYLIPKVFIERVRVSFDNTLDGKVIESSAHDMNTLTVLESDEKYNLGNKTALLKKFDGDISFNGLIRYYSPLEPSQTKLSFIVDLPNNSSNMKTTGKTTVRLFLIMKGAFTTKEILYKSFLFFYPWLGHDNLANLPPEYKQVLKMGGQYNYENMKLLIFGLEGMIILAGIENHLCIDIDKITINKFIIFKGNPDVFPTLELLRSKNVSSEPYISPTGVINYFEMEESIKKYSQYVLDASSELKELINEAEEEIQNMKENETKG